MKRSIDEGTEDEEFGADFAGADEGVFGLEPPLGYGSSSADESGAKRQRLDDAANNSPPPPAFDRKVDVAAASAVETPPVSSVGEAPRADDVEDEDDLDADDQHQQHDQQPADPAIDAESKPEPAAEALPPTAAAPAPVPAPVPAPEPIYYSTPLDKFQLKFCNRILGRAKRLKDAFMFLQPVDPIKLNIPTYFHFIKRPMDLSTIQKKLDGQVYKTAHGFIDDVTLMFDNCYTFNGRDSAVGLIAQNFQRYFTQQLEKMPNQIEPEKKRAPPSSAASHLYHAPPAPIERPKRDVQPLIRDNLSPARKPLSKQAVSDLKYAANVVRELMKPRYQKINHPFLVPVDPVALGIPTYPLIIKHPMDFGTILRRLDAGFYSSGAEFESDSRLVFKNCYTFNAPGSEVFEMGRALEQIFDLKWREKPFVAPSTRKPSLGMVGGDSDDSSSEEEQEDLNKMQENLLKLMQEVTKLAAHKGSKKKEKHKKHKMHALLQQQALVASMAGAAAASSGSTVSAPKKKKKSSHSSRPKTSAAPIREITYQQKKELSEKIEDLSPDQLEGVYQIIRSGMPSLDTQAAGQDEIELDIDSLDKVTLSRLYHFVVNAARPTSAPPAQPKSLSHTAAAANGSSSDSDDSSGSDSDSENGSGSGSSSGSSDGGESADESFGRDILSSGDTPEISSTPATATATSAPTTTSRSAVATTTSAGSHVSSATASKPKAVGSTANSNSRAKSSGGGAGGGASGGGSGGRVNSGKNSSTAGGGTGGGGGASELPGIIKKTDVKFRKVDPATAANAASAAQAAATAAAAAAAAKKVPTPNVDVFGYVEELQQKSKKEEMEKTRRAKEAEEKKMAEIAARRMEEHRKRQLQQQQAAAAVTCLTPAEMDDVVRKLPSRQDRDLAYEKSMESYAGTWMDLHRQGCTMQDFEETLRQEMSPAYEAQLARDRAEVMADF